VPQHPAIQSTSSSDEPSLTTVAATIEPLHLAFRNTHCETPSAVNAVTDETSSVKENMKNDDARSPRSDENRGADPEVNEEKEEEEEDDFVGMYSLSAYAINEYESKIIGKTRSEVLDVVIVADKTRSKEMYCVSKHWISLKKGCVFVPKLRATQKRMTDKDEDACYKQLIVHCTPVGTLHTTVTIPGASTQARTRGGRRGKANTQERSRTGTFNLTICWTHHFLKSVLKDFCKLCGHVF
jgi:hypothetical protein